MDLRLRINSSVTVVVLACVYSLGLFAVQPPYGYSVQLTYNQIMGAEVHRTLELTINRERAGHVNYTISRVATKPSFISYLFVEKKFRGVIGCGKMLLYSAVNDILLDGSRSIELDRHPFDLTPAESFYLRDDQLKKWYTDFGFAESRAHKGKMKLVDPSEFLKIQVVTSFTDQGVVFLFR